MWILCKYTQLPSVHMHMLSAYNRAWHTVSPQKCGKKLLRGTIRAGLPCCLLLVTAESPGLQQCTVQSRHKTHNYRPCKTRSHRAHAACSGSVLGWVLGLSHQIHTGQQLSLPSPKGNGLALLEHKFQSPFPVSLLRKIWRSILKGEAIIIKSQTSDTKAETAYHTDGLP